MMSIERVKEAGAVENQRCYTVDDAIKQGEYLDGVVPSLKVIFAARNGVLDLSETNVAVVDQVVSVKRTGCTNEHESEFDSMRLTLADCPEEKVNRCANCILNITGGEELLDSMRPNNIINI
jgi:hypothetical protein